MRNSTDAYLRQALKNWAADQQPPENGRARLLLLAAALPQEQTAHYSEAKLFMNLSRSSQTPSDQAMQIYNLPWLWAAHFSLTPARCVT
jgi:hypothetical protein